MTDSPGSPLSSIASDDLSDRDDVKHVLSPSGSNKDLTSNSNMPPSKRRRTGAASWDRNTPVSATYQDDLPPAPASPSSSISSDTDGEIPNSPTTLALLGGSQEDDYSGQCNDQVTVCRWEGCDAGELGNMDDLVHHIHNDHIGTRQKKYSCEWADCNRKGQTHASGYALRAHMRSHTREKPFYCSLPECDRSFTRSDALSKHMRTVHETEALRPADPLSKPNTSSLPILGGATTGTGTATPASKLQRIKLKLSQPHPPRDDNASESAAEDPTEDPNYLNDYEIPEYGPEIGFDDAELALRPRDLYRLLRRQLHWAERETDHLRDDWERTRPKRKQTWLEKEAVFDDVIDAEIRLFGALMGGREVPSLPPPVDGDGDGDGHHSAAAAAKGLERYQYQQQQHVQKFLDQQREKQQAEIDESVEIEQKAEARYQARVEEARAQAQAQDQAQADAQDQTQPPAQEDTKPTAEPGVVPQLEGEVR